MLSYTFYCQQYALGVFFEYRDFIAWIEERNEYKKVPSPVTESIKYAVYAFACLGTFSVGAGLFPISHCYTLEFANETSLAYKLYYTFFAGFFVHYFYYIAFEFQTGAVIASGLGYNGRKEVSEASGDTIDPKNPDQLGDHQWDKFIGVYLVECELATNANAVLKNWNYRVHVWLKHYISERLTGKG